MKTLKKILIISVIAIIGILLMLFIMVYSVFWTDEHTYYDMDDCTPQQSQDIFEIMDLELYDGITIGHASYHLASGSPVHVTRYFSFELHGAEEDLLQCMTYLEQNSNRELKNKNNENYCCRIYEIELDESQSVLSFRCYLSGRYPPDLYSYILKNGSENKKLFDEHWAG